MTRAERYRKRIHDGLDGTAYHEAGHAVAALAMGKPIQSVAVFPDGSGVTNSFDTLDVTHPRFRPAPGRRWSRRGTLADVKWRHRGQLVYVVAGPVAEGERRLEDGGWWEDVCNEVLVSGFCRDWGPGPQEPGPPTDSSTAWLWAQILAGAQGGSTAADFLAAIETAERVAGRLLKHNWKAVKRVAESMLRREGMRLTGAALRRVAGEVSLPWKSWLPPF
jgi:hypothetical protein